MPQFCLQVDKEKCMVGECLNSTSEVQCSIMNQGMKYMIQLKIAVDWTKVETKCVHKWQDVIMQEQSGGEKSMRMN